jgi:3-oxoadipate enol-lactonase
VGAAQEEQPERAPELPPGRRLELPGRGSTFVREIAGPGGTPTIVLLHGWTVTSDLNWFTCYETLGRSFRVVALDQRGHGHGIKSKEPFSLEACADDVAALVDELQLGPVIPVGYSMGGAISQLVWQRHPRVVRGLVLAATARTFNTNRSEALSFLGLGGLAVISRLAPDQARDWMADQFIARKGRTYEQWALAEVKSSSITNVLEAGSALGRFSSRDWVGDVDVPAAVVVTTQDRTVPTRRQFRLAESIPNATMHRVPAGHDASFTAADRFVPALLEACIGVAERS